MGYRRDYWPPKVISPFKSINFFLVFCGYVRYYFVQLLDISIIFVDDVYIPFYVTFNIYFSTILVLYPL